MEKTIIAPSVLSADFAHLGRDLDMLHQSQAQWIHVDIMDGRFVPNISFGFPVLSAIRPLTTKHLDVHLMIEEPERYLERFAEAGANTITVHQEACPHLHRTIQSIKSLGCLAGVAVNPSTPVSSLGEVLADLDLVLIMSVNPGFGGQSFIKNSLQKVKQVKAMAQAQGLERLYIEVDGGVSLQNAPELIKAGANVLVAGNLVFSSANPLDTIAALANLD